MTQIPVETENPYARPVYDEWSAAESARIEADYAAQLAGFTDEQIAANIEELARAERDHAYTLMRSETQRRRDREFLWRYRREQERRAAEADAPVNLLTAVNQFRKEAATVPLSQAVVTDFICALVAGSTSLDSVREGSEQLVGVAAE